MGGWITVPRILYRVPSEASLGLTIGVPVYLGKIKDRKILCQSYSRAGTREWGYVDWPLPVLSGSCSQVVPHPVTL